MRHNDLVIIRGGGDLATGVAQKFYRSGIPVLILETAKPTTIRTNVALSSAVYDGATTVEDMDAVKISNPEEWKQCFDEGKIPVLVDENCESVDILKPICVVDAIISKIGTDTSTKMAPITIAMGPGFEAGKNVDAVIETMRGHDLGRLILKGKAMDDTGVPGEVGGQSLKRVVHAPNEGKVIPYLHIGDVAKRGEPILKVGNTEVAAPFMGLIRGMIRDGILVSDGMKIADIDPRIDVDYTSISDKARCLGGAVLEAYFYLKRSIKP